jgi:nicotinate-nucleotide adenylyltransferase
MIGKIAIFGGSFDPVHNAHIEIIRQCDTSFDLKKIIFVPSWLSPHKSKHFANAKHRLKMLELAGCSIDIKTKTEISLYEIEQKKKVYSYQTMDYFRTLYPKDEILMVLGSDSINDLPLWKNIDYLAAEYRFIVARRKGTEIAKDAKFLDRCLFVKKEIDGISSTQIRKLLGANLPQAGDYLDEKVYEYINENRLYKP